MAGPPVPPGFSLPYASVTDDDHTAWIVIATLLGLIYSILFGLVRVFVSWTTGGGCFHADDITLASSTTLALVQSSVVLGACSHGLGRTWSKVPPGSHEKVQQIYYAGLLLFILSLGLSKMSIVLFQTRLIATQWQRRIFRAVIIFIGIWMAASILALALQCDLSNPWLVVDKVCPGVGTRWTVISLFDILIEVVIAALACYLVWHLQMTRSRKWTVVSAFAYRLVMIVPIAFRISTHDNAGLTMDPTFREVLFVVWTQVEMHFSLISATIPVLRPVIKNLNTSYSSLGPAGSSNCHGTSTRTYKLSVLKKPCSQTVTNKCTQTESETPGNASSNATAFASSSAQDRSLVKKTCPDTSSIESGSSEQMIIRKQMSWRVEHGDKVLRET